MVNGCGIPAIQQDLEQSILNTNLPLSSFWSWHLNMQSAVTNCGNIFSFVLLPLLNLPQSAAASQALHERQIVELWFLCSATASLPSWLAYKIKGRYAVWDEGRHLSKLTALEHVEARPHQLETLYMLSKDAYAHRLQAIGTAQGWWRPTIGRDFLLGRIFVS